MAGLILGLVCAQPVSLLLSSPALRLLFRTRPVTSAHDRVVGTTLRVRLADGSTREGTALVGAVLAVASGGRTIRVRIAGANPTPAIRTGKFSSTTSA